MAEKFEAYFVKMAALGRQLPLGGLYDYLNDQILKDTYPGWQPIDLSESVPEVETEFKIKMISPDSDSDKWENMKLDEHSKASILAGLLDKYRGASNYLNDRNNPRQVTHTVICRMKSKKEKLDLSTFADGEVEHQSKRVPSDVNAHVIVGVVYGAEIYCVLTQDLADETDEDARDETKSNLADLAGQMESALDENQDLIVFKEQFNREEKQQLTRMKCRVYADLQTKSFRECGFFDAYKHCLEVIEKIRKNGGKSKAVPIAYKLCPLKILQNPTTAARNMIKNYEVDADLMTRCSNIWFQLEDFIDRAKVLGNSARKVSSNSLQNFISYIKKYQELIRKRVKTEILNARQSTEGDDNVDREFEKIVNTIENHSNFKPSQLDRFLFYKLSEAEIIKQMMNLKDISFVATLDQLKNKLSGSFDKNYALVLYVPAVDEITNEILEAMEHVENDNKLVKHDCDKEFDDDYDKKPWYMDSSKKKQVFNKICEFSKYVAKNQETENQAQFFITLNDTRKGFICQYSVYENNRVLKENAQLPSPPTELRIHFETTSENSKNVKICLKWNYPDVGYQTQFLVEYRQSGSLNSWTQQNTAKQGQKQVTINCKRGSILEFRVTANTCIGRSDFSKIVDTESALDFDGDDDDESQCSQSTLPKATQSKNNTRPHETFNKIKKTQSNVDDVGNSDVDSEVSSGSKGSQSKQHPKFEKQNVKVKANEIPLARKGPSKMPTSSEMFTKTDSQASSSLSLDYTTLPDSQTASTSSILSSCKNIGNRNGLDLYGVPLKKSVVGNEQNVVERFVLNLPSQKTGQHKTILVMGATGSGKTTLINSMINYIFGVEREDPFRFQLIEEQLVGQSQANSQTSIITAYDIHHMKEFRIPFSLTIVDTPGYGDTKGLKRDQEITEMVRKFFEDSNGIQELDVVGFVAQATLPRLTPTQTYIFDSVLSIFGKDVKENINFLLTFADSQKPPVLSAIKAGNLPCSTDPVSGDPLHHKFNNSGLFCPSQKTGSGPGNSAEKFNSFFWKMGMENFRKFFAVLATMKTKSLSLTKQVLEERKKLEATVDGLQPLIKTGLAKMEELRKTEQMITNSQAQIDANKDVKIEVEVMMPIKVDIPNDQYLTNCNKCNVTCHNPCAYKNDDDKVNCWAMDHSMPEATRSCRICPHKCVWNIHANQPYKWEYVKETQTTSSDAIKKKYEKELNRKLTAQDLIALLKRDIKENDEKVLEKVNIVAQSIKRLDEIALRPNPFSTPDYIDLIIDAEEQEKKPGFKERIQSLRKLRQMAVTTNRIRNKESVMASSDA